MMSFPWKICPFFILGIFLWNAHAQAKVPLPFSTKSSGIRLYEKEKYQEALDRFLKEQVKNPDDPTLQFNIGNSHYRLEKYEEAKKAFSDVAISGDPELNWQAFYNLGNVSYQQGKLEEAISYYQHALELNPEDEDTKHNLEFVREELKRRINETIENPPEENPQESQEDQKKSPEESEQDQAGKKQAKPSPSPSEPSEGSPKANQEGAEREGQAPMGSLGQMNRQDAENALSNLQEDRKFLLKDIPTQGRYIPGGKDW